MRVWCPLFSGRKKKETKKRHIELDLSQSAAGTEAMEVEMKLVTITISR